MGKKKPGKRKELPPIRCKGCDVLFAPRTRKQKYHNDACRVEYYERHYYAKKHITKTCPNCLNKFDTTKGNQQVYCSPECRDDAKKKRIEGVMASNVAERSTYLAERHSTMKRDGFRCTLCGRGPQDGAVLDVEGDGSGGLKTVCKDCIEGRELSKGVNHASGTTKNTEGGRIRLV